MFVKNRLQTINIRKKKLYKNENVTKLLKRKKEKMNTIK